MILHACGIIPHRVWDDPTPLVVKGREKAEKTVGKAYRFLMLYKLLHKMRYWELYNIRSSLIVGNKLLHKELISYSSMMKRS